MNNITMNYYEETGELIYFVEDEETRALLQNKKARDMVSNILYQFDDATAPSGEERIREVAYHPEHFTDWIKGYVDQSDALGDLAGDIVSDRGFPKDSSYRSMQDYLLSKNACEGALNAFDEAWKLYKE